jgi:hypothetical protein
LTVKYPTIYIYFTGHWRANRKRNDSQWNEIQKHIFEGKKEEGKEKFYEFSYAWRFSMLAESGYKNLLSHLHFLLKKKKDRKSYQ